MMNEESTEKVSNGLINALKSVSKHTNAAQKRKISLLTLVIFISAILDVVGLAAVLPLIKLAIDTNVIHSNIYLSTLYNFLGFDSEKLFVLFIIFCLFSYFIFKTAFGIFVNWLQARLTSNIGVYITRNQFAKYFQLDYLDFNSIKSSLIIRNVFYNPSSYVQWLVQPLTMILSESFIVLLIISAIAYYDLFLFTFIVCTLGPSVYFVYYALKQRSIRIGNAIDSVFPYALSSITEAINGYIDLKLAGKDEQYQARSLKHMKSYHELMQSGYLVSQISVRTNEIIALLGIILIFLYALFLSDKQNDMLILVGAFAAASYRLMPSLSKILNAFMYINKNQKTIKNLDVYADMIKNEASNSDQEPIKFDHAITFQNVGFSFPGSGKKIFKNLDFEIKRGEKIGFIGSSGSGKTTLMNLLLRFYKEDAGAILIDGVTLENKHTTSWRSRIGYVKQDIFLIDGTIKENITLGDTEVDESFLNKVIVQASLKKLIDSLPNGINNVIGERGGNLSGGQRQRIGIARSLYRNADLLIFDEATSALDTVTENEVTEAIDALSESNKTILIIAHRITTLRNCDRIYELKSGGISGIHSYKELITKVIS